MMHFAPTYVVLFNVPEWDIGWGYTGQTTFDNRHDATGKLAVLERKNSDVEYRMDVFGA